MNLYEFHILNHEQRLALVWAKGEFLAIRSSGQCNLCLYSMGNFFAEVLYRVADNKVQLVRGFKKTSCLEPYLDMVDLSEITI